MNHISIIPARIDLNVTVADTCWELKELKRHAKCQARQNTPIMRTAVSWHLIQALNLRGQTLRQTTAACRSRLYDSLSNAALQDHLCRLNFVSITTGLMPRPTRLSLCISERKSQHLENLASELTNWIARPTMSQPVAQLLRRAVGACEVIPLSLKLMMHSPA